ncbi:amidohydrolase [soil metagenome]
MPDKVVFVNGKVFVADAARSWARAVAVENGTIVAVGHESDVSEFVPGAEVIDLEGRLLTPGFTDAHVHPHHGGRTLLSCNLLEANDADDALDVIRAYAAQHPGDDWITGGGWSQGWFTGACPSAAMLDAVIADRPVFLVNSDGHGAWANSVALSNAGVMASTEDPADGRIERLEDGSPQGTLHEGAMDLVEAAVPVPTAEDVEAALLAGQRHLLSFGITGWQDAWVEPALHAAYQAVAGRGELIGRVVGALWWDRSGDLAQLETIEGWRAGAAPRYQPTTVKMMLDGVLENFTGSMLEPYHQVGGTGIDMIDPRRLDEYVAAVDAAGFQIHFHVIGDAAVRHALDAVEAARMSNGWSDLRHGLSHIQIVHPDDIARFHRLGVAAVFQPLWASYYDEHLTEPFLGEDRFSWQYPFGSLVASGATLVGGSDWSVSTCDVMHQIEVATTRRPVSDRQMKPLNPAEAIDPVTGLAAYTAGSAWFNHQENQRGTIAVGKVADLVVLDRDPFVDGPLGDALVDMTFVDGRLVYERKGT